jgi:GNAT superfamily N-acetyltransferase
MEIRRHTDPEAYERLVEPLLVADEARYNLELAVLGRIVRREVGDPLMLSVHDGDELVGAALRTPPWNLLVPGVPAEAMPGLAAEAGEVKGVLGATEATEAYAAADGAPWRVTRRQGVYRLSTLVEPRPVSGALRAADPEADAAIVHEWLVAFCDEAELPRMTPEDDVQRMREGRVWLWEDGGRPACLVGIGGYTPNGARVGPVYTPPELRGRGYASAGTAALTRLLLDRGCAYTFLYTDLANPTSNKIYRAIGYEHVADVQEVTFDR